MMFDFHIYVARILFPDYHVIMLTWFRLLSCLFMNEKGSRNFKLGVIVRLLLIFFCGLK